MQMILVSADTSVDLPDQAIVCHEQIDRPLLRRLALGGLLNGPSRIAPYHHRVGATD